MPREGQPQPCLFGEMRERDVSKPPPDGAIRGDTGSGQGTCTEKEQVDAVGRRTL
jgi:hypothetical protein